MKTIKVQVSDDGLFGDPYNEYTETYSSGARHPLTTPQIPKSVVIGELVDQWKHSYDVFKGTYNWKNCDETLTIKDCSRFNMETRQAYKVITPVPNSEPKETVEEAADKYFSEQGMLQTRLMLNIFNYAWNKGRHDYLFEKATVHLPGTHIYTKDELQSISKTIEFADCMRFIEKQEPSCYDDIALLMMEYANWQAQQQPVSKREDLKAVAEAIKKHCYNTINTGNRELINRLDVDKIINQVLSKPIVSL